MKKTLSLLLALCLLCAGAALAEENQLTPDQQTGTTTVTYTVAEKPSEFTVTIPANVSIPQGDTSTTMQISIDESSTLATGDTLTVTLQATVNDFKLKKDADTIGYKITKDVVDINVGSEVLVWKHSEAIPEAATLTLTLTEAIDNKPAGEYSDTLTFEIGLEGTTTGGVGADDLEDGGAVGFW